MFTFRHPHPTPPFALLRVRHVLSRYPSASSVPPYPPRVSDSTQLFNVSHPLANFPLTPPLPALAESVPPAPQVRTFTCFFLVSRLFVNDTSIEVQCAEDNGGWSIIQYTTIARTKESRVGYDILGFGNFRKKCDPRWELEAKSPASQPLCIPAPISGQVAPVALGSSLQALKCVSARK